MSRPGRLWSPWAAVPAVLRVTALVTAVLLGWALPQPAAPTAAGSGASATSASASAFAAAAASASVSGRAFEPAAPATVSVAAWVAVSAVPSAPGPGPRCGPGDGGSAERGPAVPPRGGAGTDHLPAAVARLLPGAPPWRPDAGPVRCPVRGPDEPAPGPVELSVMRV
ncbi:hypothetical protein [Streptomyces sp. NBC_00239]|uniref:hypothetical protein n=1 Tax=Streptomyces sp. NBC_00239 TaxID=2903640 RepID=UPI002E2D4726|nr:hypothetical protein [Streptomyces sp. NBC_00239]